jgi:hypothetical protein
MISDVQSKSKEELLAEFAKRTDHHTLEGEQFKAAIMVKCADDVTTSIESFRQTTKDLGDSSDKLSRKLFWLNVILVTVTIVGVIIAGLQVASQFKEWNNVQEDRKFDTLFRLENRLLDKTDQAIYTATENNTPILTSNGGKLSTDDLDQYLNDLTSVESAYDRKLIDLSSAYEWFAEHFELASQSKEINNYLIDIRKISPDYYQGFEQFCLEIKNYSK